MRRALLVVQTLVICYVGLRVVRVLGAMERADRALKEQAEEEDQVNRHLVTWYDSHSRSLGPSMFDWIVMAEQEPDGPYGSYAAEMAQDFERRRSERGTAR